MNFYRSFGIYAIAGFISKGFAFLLLPFFTHYLSQRDYGLITIFCSSIYFIAPLMNMGIGETLTVEYPLLTKDDVSSFISTSMVVPLTVLCTTLLCALLFHNFFSSLTGLSENLLYLICLISFFNFFCEYLFSILRNQKRPLSFGSLAISKTIMELLLAVYFIRFCKEGYLGRIGSIFLTASLISLFALFYFIKNRLIIFEFSKKWISLILKRGLPSIPLFFMMFTMYNSDTFMVNYYYGPAKAGLYGLAGQFGFLLTVINSSFVTPFYPFMYENLMKGNHSKVISLVVKYILLISGIFLLIALFTPLVFQFFIAPKFHPALYYLVLLLAGQYFNTFYLLLAGLVFYKKQNHIFYYICPLVITFTIGINYFLLHIIKVNQFAYTSALSYFFCFMVLATVCRRSIKTGLLIYIRSFTKQTVISL
ncbi:lipopolysaccharide biosynthesis protein [Pedobacter sp. L105]|uniref:lipopolysaccharide biosynthesis protein n=1 Tax=Pedobacter sp. L105 TaxID=1641871 RepID=UPI00131CDE9D|nr:oligosaccharide flippase family protein [Pedobacter sp. L105]